MRLPARLFNLRRRDPLSPVRGGPELQLPADFLWGAATASHQVEGMDTASDWWRFERQPGNVKEFFNYPEFAQSHKSDHWRRFSADVCRMKDDLGLTAYRFSIDWSRVEPREGECDRIVIERYAEMCAELRAHGIRPCVTLFHWSSPDWIWDHTREAETGWYDTRIVERFTRFCENVVPALAPHVDMFCTLNEPNVFLYGGFSEGILAPGHRAADEAIYPVLINLLRSHANAYHVIKRARPDALVGVAQHFHVFESESFFNPIEALVAARTEQSFSWLFPDAIQTGEVAFWTRSGKVLREAITGLSGTSDFTGVNYYERVFVRIPDLRRPLTFDLLHDHHGTKESWPRETYTTGFVRVLAKAHQRYGVPIYVTENGCARRDDKDREAFVVEHLRALAYARAKLGVDVRGYFNWSLLDNQEWANGFLPRLGLYAVDYATGERTLRESGKTYARIIRDGLAGAR